MNVRCYLCGMLAHPGHVCPALPSSGGRPDKPTILVITRTRERVKELESMFGDMKTAGIFAAVRVKDDGDRCNLEGRRASVVLYDFDWPLQVDTITRHTIEMLADGIMHADRARGTAR